MQQITHNREHIERLREDFPHLLGNARISIGSGWENLVRCLCENIKELPRGDEVQAVQVKEKFGGLRFYFDCPKEIRDDVQKMVRDAEGRSENVCEGCGTTSGVRTMATRHWIKSYCDRCRIEDWERLNERYDTVPDEEPEAITEAKVRLKREEHPDEVNEIADLLEKGLKEGAKEHEEKFGKNSD